MWKEMDGMSNPPACHRVIPPRSSVETPGESGRVFPRINLHPEMCGNSPHFPQGFPRVVHTVRASSSLRAWTFLRKAGSLATVSSTFRIEWMTVE